MREASSFRIPTFYILDYPGRSIQNRLDVQLPMSRFNNLCILNNWRFSATSSLCLMGLTKDVHVVQEILWLLSSADIPCLNDQCVSDEFEASETRAKPGFIHFNYKFNKPKTMRFYYIHFSPQNTFGVKRGKRDKI